MEIVGEDDSKILIKPNWKTVFGRGSGFNTTERTVSRRHVLFSLKDTDADTETDTEPTRACFEVIGSNPIWVRSGESGEVKVFRRLEKGEVAVGDWFCVGGQSERPVWFRVKRSGFEEEEEEESNEDWELENVDVSNIDSVKEFGFLVIGHEFDSYPKRRIPDIKNWDWFLEEPRKDSDDDDEGSDKRKKRGTRRKRGKTEGNDDDDWTGESEEEKEVIAKVRKVPRPTYSTRSKKPPKGTKGGRGSAQKKAVPTKGEEEDEVVDDEDEDDPTLGGFVVDDEDLEEESDMDQEEEEEFDDDSDDEDQE